MEAKTDVCGGGGGGCDDGCGGGCGGGGCGGGCDGGWVVDVVVVAAVAIPHGVVQWVARAHKLDHQQQNYHLPSRIRATCRWVRTG
jgi:hypothetical protein